MLAEQGESGAQLYLCAIYFDGQAVPRDYTEAAKWYWMAAEQDPAEAQLGLGKMYVDDDEIGVVPKDHVKAYAWYILSTAQGNEEASELKDSLREELTVEQVAEAQQLAAELNEHIKAEKPE